MRFRIALSGALLLSPYFVLVSSIGRATADNPSLTAQLEAAKPLVATIKKDAIVQLGKRSQLDYPHCESRQNQG